MAHLTHLDYLPGTFFGPSTLVEVVRHRARNQPKDTAFIYLVDGETQQVRLTYEELDRKARSIGAWLESLDLVGQRALLLYPAGLDFVAGFLGCLYAGVVAVPVYPPRRNRSLERIQAIADDAEAKVALTTDTVLGRIEALIDETPHLKELSWLDTCHLPEGLDERWQLPDIHGDTLAFLQYTSGSTGTPKGVVLNHANLVHNSALISHAFEHTRSCMGVFWLPSYHDMGLIGGILQPLYIGRPNVLMSPMTFLQKPYRWLSAISRFAATTSGGPNFAYDLCVQKITAEQRKTLDLSRWTVAFNGAEPVRAETLDRFSEVFEPCGFRREAFYPCFGLAEATLIVSGGYVAKPPVVRDFQAQALANNRVVPSAPGAAGGRRLVGCGETLPDQKIAIADPEDLTTCPPGWIGEIWVHGTSVAQGYWRQPEATDATFHAYLKDSGEGPFLRTGDLGFIADGELFVTGRLKDLIIVHGTNYYPQDVERTVQQSHPRLRRDCGAAFTAERDGREELVVVQEVERHKKADFGPVFRAIRRAVAGQHDLHLDAIVLVKAGSIPKTSSGKIQRHACRHGYLNGTLDVVGRWRAGEALPETREAAEEPPAAARPRRAGQAVDASKNGSRAAGKKEKLTELVLEEIHRVAKERDAGLTLDSPIIETGLDSLERMEILASLEERFGGRFPPELLPQLETARQLIDAVEQHLGVEPRQRALPPAGELPAETYRFELFPEYRELRQRLDLLAAPGVGNPFFSVHQGITNDRTVIGGRELINFASYNYVGMSGDPAVSKAAKEAIDRYGTSVSASRLASGEKDLHGELERALAGFLGTEAALSFVGGHSTNETVIGHLVGPGDLVLHDALAHNSIIQGALLSGARRRPFAHNDHAAADALLAQFRHEYRRVLMVIEGVYSMDGDIPDLPRFVAVKKRHKALLMIDEAHSLGVLGRRGRGIGEHFGVPARDVDVWMGTMSKTLGSCGGYIAGGKELIEYLKYTVPGFVFSVGLPPAGAAAALAALRLLEAEPGRVARLRDNARLFLTLARGRGLNTGTSQDSAVVPVILGNSLSALRLSQAMLARGINVQPILHPAVEESAARLRFFITSLHTEEQIRHTVEVLAEEWEKLGRQPVTQAAGG
ncbi:MAG: aminotransferase class I/II-fold pyridoxal phosphate-dependent enzyme [Thermoguttaceae bacterium]